MRLCGRGSGLHAGSSVRAQFLTAREAVGELVIEEKQLDDGFEFMPLLVAFQLVRAGQLQPRVELIDAPTSACSLAGIMSRERTIAELWGRRHCGRGLRSWRLGCCCERRRWWSAKR